MHSKIILAAVVALFSLGAVAQANDDRSEMNDRDAPHMTGSSTTEGRGDRNDRHERGERHRDRDETNERHESREGHNEADEHRRR